MKKFLGVIFTLVFFTVSVFGQNKLFNRIKNTNKNVIHVMSYTDEISSILQKFKNEHPDFEWEFDTTIVYSYGDEYKYSLEETLTNGGEEFPDIFITELDYLYQYTNGYMEKYSMPYQNLGIDMEKALKESEIANYAVELGSNSKGEVIALSYTSSAGVFIYRRSIAKKVLGTDDPQKVAKLIGSESGKWNKFLEVAKLMKKSNVAMIPSYSDLWKVFETGAKTGWVNENRLYIDPMRKEFMDIAKEFVENDYTNNSPAWSEAWFSDMNGTDYRPCFGFFGPSWLLDYIIMSNSGDTYGDWAICPSPVGFYWGGTQIHVNAKLNDKKKEAVKQIIEWITLDASKNGFQYLYASGEFSGFSVKEAVPSSAAMKIIDGKTDFLNNQDQFPVFIKANKQSRGNNNSPYDIRISDLWLEQVREYVNDEKSKAQAIRDFENAVAAEFLYLNSY